MLSNLGPQTKVFSGRYQLFQTVAAHQCPPSSISHQAFYLQLSLSLSQMLSEYGGQPTPCLALETILSKSIRWRLPDSFWIEPYTYVWMNIGV